MKNIINVSLISILFISIGSSFSIFSWDNVYVRNCSDKTIKCRFNWVGTEGITWWYSAERDIKSKENFKWTGNPTWPLYRVQCGKAEALSEDDVSHTTLHTKYYIDKSKNKSKEKLIESSKSCG